MPYDTILIGLGCQAVPPYCNWPGAASACWDRTARTNCTPGGSTHVNTCTTRCTIGEGEQYVPFVLRAHEIWREIKAETGKSVLH